MNHLGNKLMFNACSIQNILLKYIQHDFKHVSSTTFVSVITCSAHVAELLNPDFMSNFCRVIKKNSIEPLSYL